MAIILLFAIGEGDGLSSIAEYSGGDIEIIMDKIMPTVQILTGLQLILGILYYGVFQSLSNGGTLGKKLLHIRIICIDGSEFSMLNSILRYIVNTITMQCFLPSVIMFFTTYRQALHDLVVKTIVVDE
jgi:uncharacterized RDD family membrane protein YckC